MDEQTTPKKVRRVGSIAFALVLIAAGVLLIVYQFVPQFDLLKILKFSPVILIALGIEMLVYSARPDVKVKFDWLAMLGTAFTLCIVGTAALLPLAISEWNPARDYARNRIESQKADAMYSALTADPALKAKLNSLNVEVHFFHEADGDYTLQSGDDCILYAALQGPYADAETFAADCMAVMQRAADDGLGFTCYHFNADEDTDDGISYYLDCVASYPAGLTAAYYLAKKGHEVTVFEKNPKAGGQCRYGIPAYRLPDQLLDREINTILESGIELRTNTQPTSPDQLLEQGYDTVLVAVGTHKGTRLPLEGSGLPQVYVNTDFLKQARLGTPLPVSGRVMILGGGNVAYDCARTALRLGAEEVHMACLENEQQMTSTPEEIAEGAEEGILLHAAHSFLRITGTDRVEGVELQKVNRFYFDENRKAVIELEEGTNQVIPVDHVIFAVGQRPEDTEQMGLELTHGPYILADENYFAV